MWDTIYLVPFCGTLFTWFVELLSAPARSGWRVLITRFLLHHLTLITLLYQTIIYNYNQICTNYSSVKTCLKHQRIADQCSYLSLE